MTRRIKLYTHTYIYITCEITELPHESLLLPSYTVQPSDYSGEKKKKNKNLSLGLPPPQIKCAEKTRPDVQYASQAHISTEHKSHSKGLGRAKDILSAQFV